MRVTNPRRWNRRKAELGVLLTVFILGHMATRFEPNLWVIGPALTALFAVVSSLDFDN